MTTSLDFDLLTPDVASPEVFERKARVAKPAAHVGTPVVGWIENSLNNGVALAVVVKTDDEAKTLARLLRAAASDLGKGVKIRTDKTGKGATVTFQVAEKRQYTKRPKPEVSE